MKISRCHPAHTTLQPHAMLARRLSRVSPLPAVKSIAGPSTQHVTRRHYAQPLNPSTSVDPRLGTVPPPAPLSASSSGKDKSDGPSSYYSVSSSSSSSTSRPNNPNDLSELLRDLDNPARKSPSSSDRKTGTLASVKGTAIGSGTGAHRRGTAIPSSDLDEFTMLEQEAARRKEQERDAQEDGLEGPVSKSSVVDRESPHSIEQMQGRNELDERILNAARATFSAKKGAGLRQLNDEFASLAYRILPIELPYESTPDGERKVALPDVSPQQQTAGVAANEQDDGVLLIAFVDNVDAPRGQERISVCLGFGVEGGESLAKEEAEEKGTAMQAGEDGELVVTIAHTLRSATDTLSGNRGVEDKSAAFAITRSGHVYPVRRLVSSLPNCDLVLFQLAKEPLPVDGNASQESTPPRIKTLPISPYPAQPQTHLCVSSFWGFEDDSGCALPRFSYQPSSSKLTVLPETIAPPAGRSAADVASEGDSMAQSRWGEVRLIEYKDGKGSTAQPGTYDSLETLEYKLVKDSRINPAVLRGERPAYLPSSAGISASSASSPSLHGNATTASTTSSPPTSQGFGGYGVPNFPPPGSSGGPIVDLSTGAVVGVTRGCKMTTIGGRRGEGIPSEKIFECFLCPGLGKKSRK